MILIFKPENIIYKEELEGLVSEGESRYNSSWTRICKDISFVNKRTFEIEIQYNDLSKRVQENNFEKTVFNITRKKNKMTSEKSNMTSE